MRQENLWYLPLQEREAVAMEMTVKDNQRDVNSSLVCIAWSLLNIISNSEFSLLKNEHLPHIIYHQWSLHL